MKKTTEWVFIFFTFLAAWVLMILPIPNEWQKYTPEWLMLVVIYWIFTRSQFVGITIAWCAGLVMDLLYGGVLGQYALSMMTVAFFARFLRYRIRFMPTWERWLMMFILFAVGECILFLVQWTIGHPHRIIYYLIPVLSSLIVWPSIRHFIHFCERKIFA